MRIQKKFKICRRLGNGVFDKCSSQQFQLSEQKRRANRSMKRPKQLSEYGKQLLEKQKLKISYGLKEKGLVRYTKKALFSKDDTVTALYKMLENRLDNVIYRLGFAETRAMARQIVVHGHIYVNGRKLNVPSYQVRIGDKITVKESSRENAIFSDFLKKKEAKILKWLKLDKKTFSSEIIAEPELDTRGFDFKKIIEFYTR